jgi:hypothetical protein
VFFISSVFDFAVPSRTMTVPDSLFPSLTEIESALSVFQYFISHPECKEEAKNNPALASLFKTATTCLYPSKEERRANKKDNIKSKKVEDQELLGKSVIRTNRKLKLVGQASMYLYLIKQSVDLNSSSFHVRPSSEASKQTMSLSLTTIPFWKRL